MGINFWQRFIYWLDHDPLPEDDALRPCRGIIFALGLSLIVWVLLGGFWLLFL